MRPSRAFFVAILFLLMVGGLPARAQIVNGDFESDTGWTEDLPPGWGFEYYYDLSIDTRYGWIKGITGAGLGCIRQTFQCGEAGGSGQCVIGLDAVLIDMRPGLQYPSRLNGSLPGRLKLFVDGNLLGTIDDSPLGFGHLQAQVPCGQHEIALCLEVDAGNEGIGVAVDNVTASCEQPTPAKPRSWGRVKIRYR